MVKLGNHRFRGDELYITD